jgi:hypothetical protein
MLDNLALAVVTVTRLDRLARSTLTLINRVRGSGAATEARRSHRYRPQLQRRHIDHSPCDTGGVKPLRSLKIENNIILWTSGRR